VVGAQQTFVFTDIEDSTGRASRLGDSAWSALLGQHNEVLTEVVANYAGREVKKTGDGAMLVFDDAAVAILCVRDLQFRFNEIGLPVRAGVHCGEAIDDGDGDFIGMQVHVAARVGALAAGGELLVSAAARHEVGAHPSIHFGQPRTVPLRGVPGLHRLYPVVGEHSAEEMQRSPLVGRDEELGILEGAVDAVRHGRGGSVLIAGEPGAGKSRLVKELEWSVSADGHVGTHWGHCWDREGAPAYLPWMEIIRSLVATGGIGSDHAELVHIVPELATDLGPAPRLPSDPEVARNKLFGAVIDVIRQTSSLQPIAIILEDLHRADATSLDLLRAAADALGTNPVLFVATARDTETEVMRELHEILGLGTLVKLSPLAADAVATYLANELGHIPEEATVRAVVELTESNAFNLTQIAPLLRGNERAALPGSVGASIRKRLESLSPDATWILEVAATLGTTFSLAMLGPSSGLSGSAAITALDEAANARLVLWDSPSDTAAFAHQLLQKAMYERIPAGRRAVLHGQVARTMVAKKHPDDPVEQGLTAFHYVQAVPAGFAADAIDSSRRAAEMASAMHAHREAARYLQDALNVFPALEGGEELTRLALIAGLGHAELAIGKRVDGFETLDSMMEPAMALGAGDLAAQALLSWPADWVPSGAINDQLFDRLLALLPPGHSKRPVPLALKSILWRYRDNPNWKVVAEQAWDEAVALQDDAAMAEVLSRVSEVGPKAEMGTALIELGQKLGDEGYLATGWRDLGRRRLEAGDGAGAESAFAEQCRLADEVGAPLPKADARWRLAGLAINRGDVDSATVLMAEANDLEELGRDKRPRLVGIGLQVLMARNAGRIADFAFLASMDALVEGQYGLAAVRSLIALLGLAGGSPDLARALLSDPPSRPFLGGELHWRLAAAGTADMALCLADEDGLRTTRAALRQAPKPVAMLPGSTALYAHFDEIIGRADVALGDTTEGVARLQSALSFYKGLDAGPLMERTQAVLDVALSADLSPDLGERATALALAAWLPALPATPT
jgi:class 3 adenylate cyclase